MKLDSKDWPKEWPTQKEIKIQLALGIAKKYIIYPAGSSGGPIIIVAWNMKCARACVISKYKMEVHKWPRDLLICHEYTGNAGVDIWCLGVE